MANSFRSRSGIDYFLVGQTHAFDLLQWIWILEKSPVYFKNKPQRKKGYDYDLPGAYFVTICVKDRRNLFGDINKGSIAPSSAGCIANNCWLEIPEHFDNVGLGEYTVMPNHFHGIVNILGEVSVGQTHAFDTLEVKSIPTENEKKSVNDNRSDQVKKMHKKLSIVIGSFKSAVSKLTHTTTQEIHFAWQTSFYDHIVRNDRELEYISDYIRMNPLNWKNDLENREFMSDISSLERTTRTKDHYDRLFKKTL